jgi:hypothetical protein
MANLSDNRNQWLLNSDKPDILSDGKYERLDDLLNVLIAPISFGGRGAAKTRTRRYSSRNMDSKSGNNSMAEESSISLILKGSPKAGKGLRTSAVEISEDMNLPGLPV